VKLLFDENLSPRLVQRLEPAYPGSAHVDLVGLHGRADAEIWEFAGRETYAIVSKDNDFRQLSVLYGPPPKVVWLSVGNVGTADDAITRGLRLRTPPERPTHAGHLRGPAQLPDRSSDRRSPAVGGVQHRRRVGRAGALLTTQVNDPFVCLPLVPAST